MVANIFGQMFAIKKKLNIQSRLTEIGRSIIRVTNNITRTEKQLNSYKRGVTNDAKQRNLFEFSRAACTERVMAAGGDSFKCLFNDDGTMNSEAWQKNAALVQEFQNSVQQEIAKGQQQLQQTLEAIEEEYEAEYAMKVEILKDEQADLEMEKDGLTVQLEGVKNLEQQEKQFAQENIKSMFDNRA